MSAGTPTPRTDSILREINEGRVYKNDGPLADFARTLEREADSLRAERDEAVEKLAGRESYRAKNPLGGVARMFDAMADRIRAGENYASVLDDYGLCDAAKLAAAEAQLAAMRAGKNG